jgi:hypothetical protein
LRPNAVIFTILLFCAVFPLAARDVEITVVDIELDLPLEGAVIRLWDGRQYVCDEGGKAVISVPDDRRVVIQAAYPGYESGRLVVAPGADAYTLSLRLSGVMEGRELVIEAARPGTSETRTGRSVAVSGREIAQTAEIGIVEDVMNSIKLLPGVGYSGFFDAQPSIRGGDPGDMRASLDGFYVFNPYHWGGGFSIFDPRMVESAQLSHGVFSSRYGHTISGLLEITSKKPSPAETEFELGVNTSAANFNLSLPLAGKGGLMFMGRVTYYDPIVRLFQQLSKAIELEELQAINAIRTAPYIRNGIITGNYRFLDGLELKTTGFWGMDGIGVNYENSIRGEDRTDALDSDTKMDFNWTNYQGFINAVLSWNPRNDMLLKMVAGTGYEKMVLDGDIQYNILNKSFSATSANAWYYDSIRYSGRFKDPYDFNTATLLKQTETIFNTQGRIDYDWELGKGFLLAAGVQEMFTRYDTKGNQQITMEKNISDFDLPAQEALLNDMGITDPVSREMLRQYLIVSVPLKYNPDAGNKLFTSSAYTLTEYATRSGRFRTELGLRLDHYYLLGKDISLQSKPAMNPRLNMDFNVFKNLGYVQSFDLSAGTGLFSSMNNSVFIAEKQFNINELKPNRSWTSVLGARLEFPEGLNFNIEGYYKYTYDRMYVPINVDLEGLDVQPRFNGEGNVWGIDFMLQKLQSRYWDGWLSYSFSWAKYRDPDSGNSDMGISGGVRGDDWYFPDYHRFHNINLIFNIKPAPRINIYARFGFASGLQLPRRIGDSPVSYPVYVYDPDNPSNNKFIEMYYWPSRRDENNRTTPSLPLDIKFSFFGKSNSGKTRYELYYAIENVLALLYSARGNTSFNAYTGEIDTGSMSAVYEMPIPIPSFGFKISY